MGSSPAVSKLSKCTSDSKEVTSGLYQCPVAGQIYESGWLCCVTTYYMARILLFNQNPQTKPGTILYLWSVCHIYVLISSVLTLIFRKRWILENTDLQMTLQWTLG